MTPFLYKVASCFYDTYGTKINELAFVFRIGEPDFSSKSIYPKLRKTDFLAAYAHHQRFVYSTQRKTIGRQNQHAFFIVHYLY